MYNPYATVELFHLLFLRQLEGKLDKKLYALKGGCNLRFFFKSIRYSEDIDIDVTTISTATLKNKVNKIIESIDFKKILQSKSLELIQVSTAKQTETTQRWKILLQSKESTVPLPTKIEFSRRKMDKGTAYEAVDNDLMSNYHLYPILCNHYDPNTAFLQKIEALINRTQTQARDIFDLKWLLDRGINIDTLKTIKPEKISTAIENIKQIHYTDFKGHVIAYLMEEYKKFYDSKEKWNEIQTQVIKTLMGNATHATH